jgi:hypothetical protein
VKSFWGWLNCFQTPTTVDLRDDGGDLQGALQSDLQAACTAPLHKGCELGCQTCIDDIHVIHSPALIRPALIYQHSNTRGFINVRQPSPCSIQLKKPSRHANVCIGPLQVRSSNFQHHHHQWQPTASAIGFPG